MVVKSSWASCQAEKESEKDLSILQKDNQLPQAQRYRH